MKYFHRYTQQIEEEKVPGTFWLHWLYQTRLGSFFLHVFFKHAWFSHLVGWWMNTRFSKKSIRPFAKKYNIDFSLFEKQPEDYRHFNDFFYRKLKPGQRPICDDPCTLVFPCDGRHIGFQNISDTQSFFIKGTAFNLFQLLQNEELAQKFRQGTCVISRLAPVDCHRFYFPCDGIAQPTQLINGFLYSVHPFALQQNWKILGENKRWLTLFQSQFYGTIIIIEVGACCIGSVVETFQADTLVKKGDEKGYFLFGGSTVVTLFEPNRVQLAKDLLKSSACGLELYAHMGDAMAR